LKPGIWVTPISIVSASSALGKAFFDIRDIAQDPVIIGRRLLVLDLRRISPSPLDGTTGGRSRPHQLPGLRMGRDRHAGRPAAPPRRGMGRAKERLLRVRLITPDHHTFKEDARWQPPSLHRNSALVSLLPKNRITVRSHSVYPSSLGGHIFVLFVQLVKYPHTGLICILTYCTR
jgi:hypothetical protein